MLDTSPHPQRSTQKAPRRQARLAWGVCCAVILALACAQTARAAAPPADLVRAELIAEPAAIVPGQPFWVGLKLRMKEGWHVYWRNPGDSGEAPTIKWQLPPGFDAGPIVWPTPSRIPVAHLANYGYAGETTLLTEIRAPARIDGNAPVALAAGATWLVCEKECIPGEASLTLTLPIAAAGTSAAPTPQVRAHFEAVRASVPQASPWKARMDVAPDTLTLRVEGASLGGRNIKSALFFPFSETLIQHAAPQPLRATGDGLALDLARNALTPGMPTEGRGVLVIDEALGPTTVRHAFELSNVAIGAAAPPAGSLSAILQAALLALAGGIILNLMPCVFPVLSIKVLSLVKHSGQSPADVRRHGYAFTSGVLTTFLALAGALFALRAAGAEVGWGFQLQSPLAVALIAYVLFAMGLSLSGVFHFGGALQGVGAGFAQRSGYTGSFFAGVLAVVVATPCTAPFMGAALGFAMMQPAAIGLAVFLFLGLGLALPFLLLTLRPGLVGRLPRPGAWMETLKQALAFPMYATVVWLVWVLAQQVGPGGLLAALAGLVSMALAAWSFNVWQTAGTAGRRVAAAVALVSMLATGVTLGAVYRDPGAQPRLTQAAVAQGIEPFSQRRLDELRAESRPVFVNMTAAWCITCLVNEHTALATDAVRAAFASRGIVYLKGDWTNRNPEITRMLERHGRSGVPLYVLYPGRGEPVILPQVLTAATVLAEIDRIGDQAAGQRRAELTTTSKERTP